MTMNSIHPQGFKARHAARFGIGASSRFIDASGDCGATSSITEVRWLRIAVLSSVVIVLYALARWIDDMLIAQLGPELAAGSESILHGTLMPAMAVYVVLMALPFMPSAEIGIAILVMFGARMAWIVYAGTVVALTLSYLTGRLVPVSVLGRAFGLLGLAKVENLVERFESLPASRRASLLVDDTPLRTISFLVRHRFLALAILLNMPGNTVIGGGGGIALLAGMSRLFPFPLYLLTVALAVAPVPLIVLLAERV